MCPARNQLDRCVVAAFMHNFSIDSVFRPIVVAPVSLFGTYIAIKIGLAPHHIAQYDPIVITTLIATPVDKFFRLIADEKGSRKTCEIFFGARVSILCLTWEVDENVTAACDQCVYETALQKIGQCCPAQIRIIGKLSQKRTSRCQSTLHLQARFAPKQRRRVPVQDGPDVVLVKHTLKPLAIDVQRFLLAAQQIVRGMVLELVPSRVQVAVGVPHESLVSELRAFFFKIIHVCARLPFLKSAAYLALRPGASPRKVPKWHSPRHRRHACVSGRGAYR